MSVPYPDIPAIVNVELGDAVGGMSGIYVDPQLSVTEVRELTEQGLRHGEALADFELPLIALAVSTAVEVRSLLRGEGELESAIINVLSDTTGRVAVGAAGKYAGSALGVVLFGPAGAIVGGLAGTVGGGVVGGKLARKARWWLVSDEADAVRAAASDLAASAVAVMPDKMNAWQAKQTQIEQLDLAAHSDPERLRRYLLFRLQDDQRYFNARGRELEHLASKKALAGDPISVAERTLALIKRAALHPSRLQAELQTLFSALKDLSTALTRYRVGQD